MSIYFHSLDYDTEKMTYQNSDQLNGTAVTQQWTVVHDKCRKIQFFSIFSPTTEHL